MIFKSTLPDVELPNVDFTTHVLHRATELGDKVAFVDSGNGNTYTYKQVSDNVRKMAVGLHERGLQKGDVLALFSPNSPEYFITFLAVASLGGINTTINPLYTVDELTFQLNDADAKFLITIPPLLEKAKEAASRAKIQEIFVYGEAEGHTSFSKLVEKDGQLPQIEWDYKEDLAVLPYSSGTTGLPKGVMLTQYNLVANINQMYAAHLYQENDNILCVLPMFHIYGMMVIGAMGLFNGATIVTVPRFELEHFLQTMQDTHITVAPLVPPIMLALAKHPLVDKYDLSGLKAILSAAAPLSRELQEACQNRLGCIVIQGYGLTETSPGMHISPIDKDKAKAGSVGINLPYVDIKVVDISNGEALGVKQEGEIWTKGPHVMKGYLNRPDSTAATIDNDGWLHTGDIGYVDEDGYLFIVDRLKELIKYKGLQVAPAELEAVILTHPAVADAAVIPSPDEEAGEVPKAFVVLKPGVQLSSGELESYVAVRVAPHKKIRRLEFIDQIPKSASGKILRRFLVDRERKALEL
ncbi:MAG: 4-coumarate--CoA ligase family protein [Chloroflexi bacterium]|uniref:4-coumarate--CoA ligase family protein n=1 Tax=Candidatus Chlorohelix allophototropha TaxID=3003348 RepID=A0A8T7LUE4_9CHLR|nr:4-coumarate--CoA ligase family protein [Chloroflexota bacterium]WJW67528.1 4-coumarate--CoA ligase family protein [Chloroflexota bacterium L227-S17]